MSKYKTTTTPTKNIRYIHISPFFFFACINLKRFYLTNVKYPEYLETQHMKENRIMNILSQRFDPVHVH